MPINDFAGELYSGLHKRMIEALNLIARSARARASWSTKIRNAIKVGEVKEQSGNVYGYIEVDRNIAPEARAFEYGSGVHAKRGPKVKYPILPKNSSKLVFIGTNGYGNESTAYNMNTKEAMGGGNIVITSKVMHPGVEARPFLTPAVQDNKARIKQLLGEEFHQYISKAIRFSWSKNR
jgi:hypothetical protein